MKNYAGSRLSPWLGHLMISRSDTARPLLTPGEVMQLPPTDEIVMVAGTPPIRAKKARCYEDERFQERVLASPSLAKPTSTQSDDWSTRPLPPRPEIAEPLRSSGKDTDDYPTESERRHQPELNRAKTVEKKEAIDNEFAPDPDEMEDDAIRASRMSRMMQGVARQVSLDPADGMGL